MKANSFHFIADVNFFPFDVHEIYMTTLIEVLTRNERKLMPEKQHLSEYVTFLYLMSN